MTGNSNEIEYAIQIIPLALEMLMRWKTSKNKSNWLSVLTSLNLNQPNKVKHW